MGVLMVGDGEQAAAIRGRLLICPYHTANRACLLRWLRACLAKSNKYRLGLNALGKRGIIETDILCCMGCLKCFSFAEAGLSGSLFILALRGFSVAAI